MSSISPSPPPSSVHSETTPNVFPIAAPPVAVVEEDDDDHIICRWNNCDIVYRDLKKLIHHIHHDHIGSHKSSYSCEWETCQRKGASQTSRFALISHVRSHTGEKPFLCSVPECDKSFTRSDALAKHMRLQHNIEPPASGRGGNRKRKRSPGGAPSSPSRSMTPSFINNGLNEEDHRHHPHRIESDPVQVELRQAEEIYLRRSTGVHKPRHTNGFTQSHSHNATTQEEMEADLPSDLQPRVDAMTKTIDGRSIEMVLYIITKAKYKYCLEENQNLKSELERANAELDLAKKEKDQALDDVLRATFGAEADNCIEELNQRSIAEPRIREIPMMDQGGDGVESLYPPPPT